MSKARMIVTALALAAALRAAPAVAETYAGMGYQARHYAGVPYRTLGAYWNGSAWVYTLVGAWNYPSSGGTHSTWYRNWNGYTWLAQSQWWSYANAYAYTDAYAFSYGVRAYSTN